MLSLVVGRRRYKHYIYKEKQTTMGLLTPKNNKADKKAANKLKNSGQSSQFIKQNNSKPAGFTKKPVKTGGSRGS
jgi:hypothetical protein